MSIDILFVIYAQPNTSLWHDSTRQNILMDGGSIKFHELQALKIWISELCLVLNVTYRILNLDESQRNLPRNPQKGKKDQMWCLPGTNKLYRVKIDSVVI